MSTGGAVRRARWDELRSPFGWTSRTDGVYGATPDPLAGKVWKIKYIGARYRVEQSFTFAAGRATLLVPKDL